MLLEDLNAATPLREPHPGDVTIDRLVIIVLHKLDLRHDGQGFSCHPSTILWLLQSEDLKHEFGGHSIDTFDIRESATRVLLLDHFFKSFE